jgi:UDP-N-acetylmuramate--alanine ligase
MRHDATLSLASGAVPRSLRQRRTCAIAALRVRRRADGLFTQQASTMRPPQHFTPDRTTSMADERRRAHIVGIAGQGMAPLARLLAQSGVEVSGCDRLDLDLRIPLHKEVNTLDLPFLSGHDEHHLAGVSELVVSNAIPADHIEVVAARALGVTVTTRAKALGALLTDHSDRQVGVSGVYGKSTTTSLVAHMLTQLGLAPTYYVGAARLSGSTLSSTLGSDPIAVYEACEFNNDFLQMPRTTALMLNTITGEHPETHPTTGSLLAAFDAFAEAATYSVICADDPLLAERFRRKATLTFGFDPAADVRVLDAGRWSASERKRTSTISVMGTTHQLVIPLPAHHNVSNVAGAVAALLSLDILTPREIPSTLLAGFSELSRRLNTLGAVGKTAIIDDYAHSPTQIRAARSYVHADLGARAIGCLFQPSCFRRFSAQFADLATELAHWDRVWLLGPIQPCPGDEVTDLKGETLESFADAIQSPNVQIIGDLAQIGFGHVVDLSVLCCFGGPRMNGVAAQLLDVLSSTRPER